MGTKSQVWTNIKDTATKDQLMPVQSLFLAYNSLYLGNTDTKEHTHVQEMKV